MVEVDLLHQLQVSAGMALLPRHITLREALAYGAPFPTPAHKAAIVRAPRLGLLAILTASQIRWLRSLLPVRWLGVLLPGKWVKGW